MLAVFLFNMFSLTTFVRSLFYFIIFFRTHLCSVDRWSVPQREIICTKRGFWSTRRFSSWTPHGSRNHGNLDAYYSKNVPCKLQHLKCSMLVALAVDNYSAGSESGAFARAQLILIAREIGKDSSEKIWLSRWRTAERPSVQTLRVGIKKLSVG